MNPISASLWRGLGGVYVFFLLTPLVLVVLFAFTNRGISNFPIDHVSLQWWDAMLEHRQFRPALNNSLIISSAVGLISAVIGTMAAMGLARLPRRRASLGIALVSLPLMLPPLVLAVSLLSAYVAVGMKLGLTTVILGHLLFTQPFVILVVYARMVGFDYSVVESARDLGASPLKAFLTVTLPIIRPTVIGAALIAAALSLDDFIITFFNIGGGNTLPTFVWGFIRTGLRPTVNAIGTTILVFTVGSTLIALWLTRYRG
jgi:spermidine/putrescine transport system permease protein